MRINPNNPIYPCKDSVHNGEIGGYRTENYTGMNIRTHIAAMAMQGWISADYTANSGTPHEELAQWSVKMADALIEELNE